MLLCIMSLAIYFMMVKYDGGRLMVQSPAEPDEYALYEHENMRN